MHASMRERQSMDAINKKKQSQLLFLLPPLTLSTFYSLASRCTPRGGGLGGRCSFLCSIERAASEAASLPPSACLSVMRSGARVAPLRNAAGEEREREGRRERKERGRTTGTAFSVHGMRPGGGTEHGGTSNLDPTRSGFGLGILCSCSYTLKIQLR